MGDLRIKTFGSGFARVKSIEDAVVTLAETSFVYDGIAKKQIVESVVLDGVELVFGRDYLIIGDSATDAGVHQLSVLGILEYGGSVIKSWSINKLSLAKPTVTGSYTYNGNAQNVSLSNFNSLRETKNGTTSATNAGSYTLFVSLNDEANTQWEDGSTETLSLPWTINKAAGSINVNPTTIEIAGNISTTETAAITMTGDGIVSANSSDNDIAVATVSENTVMVTSVASGTATITIAMAAGTNYTGASCAIAVTVVNKPVASVTPASGTTYINGLSGLSAEQVSSFSEAISNNSAITNTISTVYIDFGSEHRKLSVGDQFALALDNTDYAFDIIGFNHDTLSSTTAYGAASATGKAGMTLQMHDLINSNYHMNDYDENDFPTNVGGWKESEMRTSTMTTMRGYLPSAWQAIIKPVNKQAGTGGGSSSGVETVSDGCFLLSEIEIFGSTTHSVPGEGSQYAYYRAGNTRVKKKSGSASIWWERSPVSGSRESFCYVKEDGNAGRSYSYVLTPPAFAFCV